MFSFGSKKSYIGADIGTSSVKMVELQSKGGKAVLVTYGYVEQPTDIIRSSSGEMEHKISEIVKNIYAKSRMTSTKVIAALPSFSVFSSIISLPNMNKKDIAQAVRWEAKKFIPLPIEEMTLDWKIIPLSKEKKEDLKNFNLKKLAAYNTLNKEESQNSGAEDKAAEEEGTGGLKFLSKIFSRRGANKNILPFQEKKEESQKILLTAAPKNLVTRYINIFRAAGLELSSLETESFALERSLVGNDLSTVMIIDIGAVSSDINIIERGIPILTRSIDVGGNAITQSLMASLNVDLSRAEQFKRDIGFSSSATGELPLIIKNSINPIINEIKYCLDIYLSQGKEKRPLEKIILTGGSAFLPDLPNYLSRLLDVKIIIGDPWDRVVYPLELKPALEEIGPKFSIAVGLAMREI
jgi:type IV pilus assembly protein PilM